ncbi:MAG: hypothetical protein ACFB51_16995, partial [Anaerolineae bacterium]
STALANMLVAMDGDLIVRPGIDLAAVLLQIWMEARAAVAGGDRVAVLVVFVRGEHYAVDAFDDGDTSDGRPDDPAARRN